MKKFLIIIILCNSLQSIFTQDFPITIYTIKELEEKCGINYLDSIYSYGTEDYLKEKSLIFKMKNLKQLVFLDNYKAMTKLNRKRYIYRPLEIPLTVKSVVFEAALMLPFPINFNSNKDILTELIFQELYYNEKVKFRLLDSLCFDFSDFDSLKRLDLIISNWKEKNPKCEVILPPKLNVFSGYIDSTIIIKSYPRTIEKVDISFGDTIPNDFFELNNLKVLYINNDTPLSSKFLKLKNIKKLKINNLTKDDIEIIKQMENLDTLYWTFGLKWEDRKNLSSKIPDEIKHLKVKCLLLEVFGYSFSAYPYSKEIAILIKRMLPDVKVYYNKDIKTTVEVNE